MSGLPSSHGVMATVGMGGICYFSSMHLHVAAEQPPHLKAIAPWEIFADDLYNHGVYEGGVLNIFLYGLYTGSYPARCGYAPKNVVSAMIKETPKAELDALLEQALSNPDLRQYPYLYQLLKYPGKNPVLFDFMLNPLDGKYYRERSVERAAGEDTGACFCWRSALQFLLRPADQRLQ